MDRNTAVVDVPETTFFSFDKPLKPQAERTLKLLMERYSDDKGQPLVKFDSNPDSPTDGFVALHIPRVIRPTCLERAAS